MRLTLSTFPGSRRLGLALLGVSCLALLSACGGGSSHGSGHGATPGMDEHAATSNGLLATEDGYTLKPVTTALRLGTQPLQFQIVNPDGKPQTDFVEDQTKLLHFYLVRRDLTGYQHLHPTLKDGIWSIDVTTAAPGPYRMYTDFIARDGAGEQHPHVLSTTLTVPGTYTPQPLPTPSDTVTMAGLTATLNGELTAGRESEVTFRVSENGKPVRDLEPYLDSFAHLTALHEGDAAYQHLHPELSAKPGQQGGPDLPFTAELPEKGTWRLFLEVQRAGQLRLIPMTVMVD